MSEVFIAGGTGYLGLPLIEALLQRNHRVTALARRQSAGKLPAGANIVLGDALDGDSYVRRMPRGATFVHLVGVAHPAPWKGDDFVNVDLASVCASLHAAQEAHAAHFVYVSVARPAPLMKRYQAVRAEAETLIHATGMAATFIRPWYVLGPGHRWPQALLPLQALAERLPALRDTALRLRCVTREQMTWALLHAIEHAPREVRTIEVADMLRGMPGDRLRLRAVP